MVYGIIKLINFAHCDVYMIGAYIGFVCITSFKLGLIPALLIAMAICTILGVLIERIAYRPLRNATRIAVLITAIGVSLLLENGMILIASPQVRVYPQIDGLLAKSFDIGRITINMKQVLILATTIILMILLQFIVKRTRIGKAMRAVSLDTEAAQLMGINVNKVISFTFAIGSALAGAAGVLVGVYYNTINPLMGVTPGLKAFVAAVLGGIGVVPGAVFGGFALGMTETIVSAYGGSIFKDAVAFSILILVLLVRPNGLLGKSNKEKV